MMGRGFALAPTPLCSDDLLLKELHGGRSAPRPGSKRWWKFPRLNRYGCWLQRLLVEALPEETLRLVDVDVRHEPAGSENPLVDKLHADGSYIRSVWTLYGPTTIYRDGRAELSVPLGLTLVMTAMDRARALGVRCTLHRRPGAGSERAVIVCSFVNGQRLN